ncbi:CCA tRNA nucleotidyltransferase [Sporosarcina jiandibaonis]|uniref:CCA tRNA nucleotidyltransferase n=1 Tax=Sporosarcina jiandibaonis TaxID=2715535 RepID=UPI00155434B8|nr:CCA tRNA nucleotidyltransferase [Sporosarcina jiandibaonis]
MTTNTFDSKASYEVIRRLEEAGHEAVFVGGAVRDHLLRKTAKDIDIATSAEPDEVKAIFDNTIDVGIAHGTVLIIIENEAIEVTTYRTEGTYTDHRRPDNVHFVKTLRDDLLRRDFTINALAMTKNGKIIDLFNGETDLKERLIRAVGNPTERFHEDALRMLRAVRFSSVLDFDIEAGTLLAIHQNAHQIKHVSIERIKIELDKLFTGVNPMKAMNTLFSSRLGKELSLYTDKVKELKRALPFVIATEGWAFFVTIAEINPSKLANHFKLSNEEKNFITAVHKLYTKRLESDYTIEDYYSYDLQVLKCAEKFFHAVNVDAGTLTDLEIEERKKALPIQTKQDLEVSGKDLMEWTDLPGGPWTGEWIKKIEQAVLHGQCKNTLTDIKDWFMNDFKCEK